MSYKKNISLNLLTQIIRIVVAFSISIIVSRVLGTRGKGEIAYILLIFGIIANYGHFGINNATLYFHKKSKYTEEEVYSVNLTYLTIILLIDAIIILCLYKSGILLDEYNINIIFIGIGYIFAVYLQTCMKNFFIGREKMKEFNLFILFEFFLEIILVILFISLGIFNIETYFLIKAAVVFFSMLVMLNASNIRIKPKIIKNLILEEHKYGLIIYFSALFIFLNYRVDQLFIKHYLSMSDLGVYSVGVMIAELIFLIPTSVQLALDSRFYNMTKDSVERVAITKITIKYTLYLCLIIVFIGSAFTPLIPIVYGKEFAEASMITVILFWGVVFASIGKVSASYFFSQGRPQVHLVNTLITFLVNISLNIVLIPRLGIRGAAIASSIAYLVYGGSYIIYFIRKESFRLYDFFVLSKDDKILIRNIFFRLLRLGGK